MNPHELPRKPHAAMLLVPPGIYIENSFLVYPTLYVGSLLSSHPARRRELQWRLLVYRYIGMPNPKPETLDIEAKTLQATV